MNIMDIASAINKDAETSIVGIRPGEKLHEQMIGLEDAFYTYEYDYFFKILPQINEAYLDPVRIGAGKKVSEDFMYASDNNSEWMSIEVLKAWIKDNELELEK